MERRLRGVGEGGEEGEGKEGRGKDKIKDTIKK